MVDEDESKTAAKAVHARGTNLCGPEHALARVGGRRPERRSVTESLHIVANLEGR
jgi:hypothetical protein